MANSTTAVAEDGSSPVSDDENKVVLMGGEYNEESESGHLLMIESPASSLQMSQYSSKNVPFEGMGATALIGANVRMAEAKKKPPLFEDIYAERFAFDGSAAELESGLATAAHSFFFVSKTPPPDQTKPSSTL
jgi:hypothetical protein